MSDGAQQEDNRMDINTGQAVVEEAQQQQQEEAGEEENPTEHAEDIEELPMAAENNAANADGDAGPNSPASEESNAEENDDNNDNADDAESSEVDERSKSKKEMTQIIQKWEWEHTTHGYNPVPTLRQLAEIFEREVEVYMRKDPDPLDMRHPYRADPSCQYGLLLKLLFRKDQFMNKLVNDYLRENFFMRQNVRKNSLELNIVACRLILDIMPGLETSAVFQADNDNLINRLYNWAEDSIDPLQSYATGLLAAALEVTDIAITYREQNTRLVPKMLKRLHMLQAIYKSSQEFSTTLQNYGTNPFQNVSGSSGSDMLGWAHTSAPQSPQLNGNGNNSNMSLLLENSRDAFSTSGTRYYKRIYIPLHPPTTETSQMLIVRYLTSMGEYQEFLGMVFEHNAMQLIFNYMENLERRDTCLAFEVLKYLSSLLCHKKFALEFLAHGGLELLLKVPRPSLATTGVSITFYYLAYCEDAMERICVMPKAIITDLVRYALWILGRSHDSGKCHATMFFSFSFQFKVILDEFDAQDGLRKLYNVISILKILNPSDHESENSEQNDDVECASRQMVRHVCVALKRYMESHFYFKYTNFLRQHCGNSPSGFNKAVAAKVSLDQLSEQIRMLQEHTSVRAHWEPVDNLLKLGGINLLLKVITFCYDWNNGGRSETVRSALDVLSICCVIPRVFVAMCDRLQMPDKTTTSGICSILGAAAGDITAEAEVQKSALAVLCHCVCSPIVRKDPNNLMKCFGTSSKKNKANHKYLEDIVERVWASVCSNNGIIVLLSLMQTKAPITDADCIRGMACRALAGLARSERVRQIVGKLPLFASGQIQTLMRDPILQEKRAEHVIFQKYALELLQHISGETKPINNPLDPSLSNMHKANVIAQTKIAYNDQQLFQLIHEHLESKGMSDTAQMLQKEARLQLQPTTTKNFHQSPFDYKVLSMPSSRSRLRSRMQDVNMAINSFVAGSSSSGETSFNNSLLDDGPHCSTNGAAGINSLVTPIKIRKTEKHSMATVSTTSSALNGSHASNTSSHAQRSLQKQVSSLSVFPEVGHHPDELATSPPNTLHKGITLNTIVTEYLTNQHALCNNPVTTCPPFDLYVPHKCPDPKPNRLANTNQNLSARQFRAQAGFNTARFDRRYVHTNFAPWRTIRSVDFEDTQFTSCAIVPNSKFIVVGSQQGEAKVFNINDGVEQFTTVCHNYNINTIHAANSGEMVLTSCLWDAPISELWSIRDNEFTSMMRFDEVGYCEFGNVSQDKVIGTQHNCAVLYDVNKGSRLATFTPTIPNQYSTNRATLCRTDELLLSDGVLWDVRSGREIHKFDKFNQCISGVFHPNCLEIISNTEVWDLRTFHLLQTVPVLDQRIVQFSPMNVIYGAGWGHDNCPDFEDTHNYDTSFNVLDAYDYSSIATIDVKRNIYDLSVSGNGSLIALVEHNEPYDAKDETYVKIYAVGVKKSERRDEEDEDEEPDSEDDGSDSSGNGMSLFFLMSPNFMGFPLRSRRGRGRNNIEFDLDDDDDDDDDDDEDEDDDDEDDDDDDNDDDDDDSDDDDDDDDNVSGDDDDYNVNINMEGSDSDNEHGNLGLSFSNARRLIFSPDTSSDIFDEADADSNE